MATKPEVGQEVTFHLDRGAYPDQANRPAELRILHSLYDDTPILVTGGQRSLSQVACMWNGPRQKLNHGRRHKDSTGIRDRSNDLQRDKKATQSKKAELHWDKLPEEFDRDTTTDYTMKIASWNVGIGGLHSEINMTEAIKWMRQEHIAILYLQEVRIVNKDLRRIRKMLKRLGPEMGMFVHCHTTHLDKDQQSRGIQPPAVATLYRKEVGQWIRPLTCSLPGRTALQGRMSTRTRASL